MNKKNILFILIVGIVIIGVLLFALYTKTEVNTNNTTDTKKEATDQIDYGKDSFSANTNTKRITDSKSVKIDDLRFTSPVPLNNATVADNTPHILQATKDYLLFEGNGGFLYFYDIKKQQALSVTKDATTAFISDDESYIIYSKNNLVNQGVYYYDLKAQGYRGQVTTTPVGVIISKVAYADGLVYSTYYDPQDPAHFYTEIDVLPEFINDHLNVKNSPTYENTSSAGAFLGNDYYIFDPVGNYISWVQPGTNTTLPRIKTNITLPQNERASDLDFNNNHDWLIRTSDDNNLNGTVFTKDGAIPNHTHITEASWVDNTHILFVEDSVSYLYNTTTKKETSFKTNVADTLAYQNNVYINDNNYDVSVVSKK